MMEIGRKLLKVRLGQLIEKYAGLEQRIADLNFEEAKELKIFLHLKRQEAEMLETSIDQAQDITPQTNEKFIETLHQLKRDFHIAHRKWQALYPSQTRRRLTIAA